jgi:hypothetical protein
MKLASLRNDHADAHRGLVLVSHDLAAAERSEAVATSLRFNLFSTVSAFRGLPTTMQARLKILRGIRRRVRHIAPGSEKSKIEAASA